METMAAVQALGALAQETRLRVYRLLVQAGPAGKSAGWLASKLALPAATLSFHLRGLRQVGLIAARHEGRFIIYCARFDTMNDLVVFLTENCCGGNVCMPLRVKRRVPTTAREER